LQVEECLVLHGSEPTRDGLCKRFAQGTYTGGDARYGYQILEGEDGRSRRAIDPVEIEVVRKVIQMYQAEPDDTGCWFARRRDESQHLMFAERTKIAIAPASTPNAMHS
jgi:hypothetical protein